MSLQDTTLVNLPATARATVQTAEPAPPSSASPLRGMMVLVLGTLTVTGLTFFSTRLYASRYGAADLSAILIFRIYGSVLVGLFGLGMPIALQRNVAYLAGTAHRAGTAALVGLGIGTGSFGAACAASAFFSERISAVLRHPGLADVWRAFLALAFFQAFGCMVELIQIARNRWIEASLVTAATMGVAPLLGLLVFPRASLSSVLLWSAAPAGIFALPSFFEICRWSLRGRLREVARECKLLLRYGVPRAVGNAAEPILDLLLPGLALLSGAGIVGAGAFAIGLALLRPLNPITGAMSLILTPAAAKLAARADAVAQANQMHRITEWAVHVGLFSTVQLVIWADVLVRLWLGTGYAWATGTVRIICLSLAPTFFYASIRGIIDGENEQPVNTLNLLLSVGALLIVAAGVHFLRLGDAGLAISYFLSRVTLGWLTLRYAIRTHAADLKKLRTGRALAFASSLGLATLCVRAVSPERFATAELFLVGPASLLLFVAGMGRCGTEWAQMILLRLRTAL